MVHGMMTLIKYALFLFNFIFWLCGLALIVPGAMIQIKNSTYINFLGNSALSAPIILIVSGCIVAILGFFGCCGAIRENYCMTMTFAVLLGVIFVLELAAGIASYVLRNDVEEIIYDHSVTGMDNYNQTGSEGVTLAWDNLQSQFHCCGTKTYADWENSTAFRTTKDFPDSCCKKAALNCAHDLQGKSLKEIGIKIYTEGCLGKLKEWVVRNIAVVSGVACGVAVIQILGICFACCLSKSILKDYQEYLY